MWAYSQSGELRHRVAEVADVAWCGLKPAGGWQRISDTDLRWWGRCRRCEAAYQRANAHQKAEAAQAGDP